MSRGRWLAIALAAGLVPACEFAISTDGLTGPSSGTDASGTTITDSSTLDSPSTPDAIGSLEAGLDAGSAYAHAVLVDTPIGYWRLGDATGMTAHSELGIHNGTYFSTTSAPSLINDPNTAAHFAASDVATSSLARIPRAPDLEPTTAITVECWAKLDALPTGATEMSIVSYGQDGTVNEAYLLYFRPGGMGVYFGDTASANHPTALQTGVAYYMVGTFDGSTANFYENGTLVATAVQATPLGSKGNYDGVNGLSFGAEYSQALHQSSAVVDEVAVYTHVLTADRILAHYNAAQ